MPRIRSIHPGLWTDEAFVSVSMPARLLAIGIWNECDDGGAFEWKPIQIKMRLMPADAVDAAALLDELAAADLIARYEVNGKPYGAVRNFGRFQRPKKPNRVHPMPEEMRIYAATSSISPEPEEDNGGGGSPSGGNRRGTSSEPVGNQFGTGGEKSAQMEEGGDKGKKYSPLSPPSEPASARDAARGSRLPEGWTPGVEETEFASGLGLNVLAVADQFRDYWHARPGKEGRKVNWTATWRNWCRREAERRPRAAQQSATVRENANDRAFREFELRLRAATQGSLN